MPFLLFLLLVLFAFSIIPIDFRKQPFLQHASARTLTSDCIPMSRPTCHIILTHPLDLPLLPALELRTLTP